ncbi:hypothetical protein HJG60_009583 [Phyllostomus discolor]|uniref:Uncharacterized protein n=1 Tax=Phyllostomus discolor TaxID=89673 RepID=A0A834DAV6_9CHIR|nr:hypothetical protein HJG60_009583 [Phyllostomus discolor]
MTSCGVGGSRLGEQFKEDADRMLCVSPCPPGARAEAEQQQAFPCGPWLGLTPAASRPAFRPSAGTQCRHSVWAPVRAKQGLGTASAQPIKDATFLESIPVPRLPGETARCTEVDEGIPCPRGPAGPFPAKMGGQDVREVGPRWPEHRVGVPQGPVCLPVFCLLGSQSFRRFMGPQRGGCSRPEST